MNEHPTFTFDGRSIAFRPGQTVGAALVAQGVLAWRTTRVGGRPRGLFCGIGVCFDCLVVIDDRDDVRACREPAAAQLDVRTRRGVGEVSHAG